MLGNQIRGVAKPGFFLACALLLVGCSRAPSVDVMGSFFPAWLGCLAAGRRQGGPSAHNGSPTTTFIQLSAGIAR